MLSRVADALYWIGRYAERIETNANIASVQLNRILEHSINDDAVEKEWEAIIEICGYYEDFKIRYPLYSLDESIYYLLFDHQNLNSIESLVTSVRLNMKNARDIVPEELWGIWHDMHLMVQRFSQGDSPMKMELSSFLMEIRNLCLMSTGIIDTIMTRDESYMFLKIGKWLERAEKTALIQKTLLELEKEFSFEYPSNYSLLLSNTQEDYTRRHRMRNFVDVIQFLMADNKCTRSVNYCIKKIHTTILDLQNGQFESYTDEIFKSLFDIKSLLQSNTEIFNPEQQLEWVKKIHQQCINFGPIFSRTYYLTPPILVE